MLPDQPADQGLQRSGVRVRREPVRRLPGERRGGAVRRLRLLVGADDERGQERDRIRPRSHLSEGQPPPGGNPRHARIDPAHHRTPHPRHVPREPRPRLPQPRHRDAHLRDRLVQRTFRVRGVGGRARRDHRPRPVRGRRPRVRPPQLHDRRLRLRRPRRSARHRHPARRRGADGAARGATGRRARADLPAAAQPGRAAAAAGRVQAAPLRQRLCRAAEDGDEAVDRRRDVRPDGGGDRRDGRDHPARADALRGGHVHPGLRGNGVPQLPHQDRKSMGALPRTGGSPGAAGRRMGIPPESAARRERRHGIPQAPRGAVLRAGARTRFPSAGGPDGRTRRAAAAGRGACPGGGALAHRVAGPAGAVVTGHRRGPRTRRAECRRTRTVSGRRRPAGPRHGPLGADGRNPRRIRGGTRRRPR